VRFQTRHPACVEEWIPVCTGMTVGGAWRGCAEFLCETVLLVFSLILYSSNFFFLTSVCRLFLSILFLVILADAGIHRTASVVVWYGISASLPVLLLVSLYVVVCGECISKRDIRRVWMNGFPCARE
ncbi:hypothetical protein ACFJZ3_004397, partial [Vibrio vulnificus]